MALTAKMSITAPIIKEVSTIHHTPVVLRSILRPDRNRKPIMKDNMPKINKIQEEIVAKALNIFGISHLLVLM